MVFICDYFALGLAFVLCLFYFDQNRFLTKASKFFALCLVLTCLTILLDLATGWLQILADTPLWISYLINSLYFFFNILTTTSVAMFLFAKILEHVFDPHCMKNANRAMGIILCVYTGFIIANLFTGLLFYFDDARQYQRGPLNAIGYVATVVQMFFVLVCFFRNRKDAPRSMSNALIQTFPVILICIMIQRTYPQIMLNGMIFAMADLVLFLNFQGQRPGIHTLTKLKNRSRFFSDLRERLDQKVPFQILMVCLKHFGDINQKYGHQIGDEALYQYACRLEKMFSNSTAYHMNGTVFVLVLPYTCEEAADSNAKCVETFLKKGMICAGHQLKTDYIVVNDVVHTHPGEVTDIYKELEYAAKTAYQRREHAITWNSELKLQMRRELYLIDRLQHIDRAHGYQVWFQPIYCLRTERFCSAEALLRVFEPDGSCISPGELIPLAEQTGMIQPVTWFVVEEVCRFLSSCDIPLKAVSVNLPMTHLLEDGFLSQLNGITDRYGVAHDRIHLEFTERETLADFAAIKQVMTDITKAGYKFYLDDFGTGYSNFSAILQLPFYGVKLDKSLSDDLTDLQASRSLVGTLTQLLHSMDFLVITEGAETFEQVQAHCRHDVDRIQGFYYTKPMDEAATKAFYHVDP